MSESVRVSELREQIREAIRSAWSNAERETYPDEHDPGLQDFDVEAARSALRPLLRHLGLVDELRELDEAWGDGTAGLRRVVLRHPNVDLVHCAILPTMDEILTRVDLVLAEREHVPDLAPTELAPLPAASGPSLEPNQTLTITARNFYGLRDFSFAPTGVTVLVGPNGAGKTTVLLLLEFLRTALDRGLPDALTSVLGGARGLKHRDASEDDTVDITVSREELRWLLRLQVGGEGGLMIVEESLHEGSREVFRRDALGALVHRERLLQGDRRLGLRAILDSQVHDAAVEQMVACLRGVSVYLDPDLHALREGSNTSHMTRLARRGTNALTMLRAWQQRRPDRGRHALVLQGLREAFPRLIEDLDFVEAGSTLAARVYRPGREQPEPLRNEANGVISMLVLLCDLAAADEGDLVAIDEPETALHPYAIRTFVRYANDQARKRGVRVVLSTHSPALLDEFNAAPERVFVLDGQSWPGPRALVELKNPDWIRRFKLGELYGDGVMGSNDDP